MGTDRTIEELERHFAIAGVAHVVAGQGGLPKVRVSAPQAEGEIYLHGAQVTSWKPTGAEDAIFLSRRAQWNEGIAIRGGIPICFPWFRAKADDPRAPSHGFVRTKAWRLESVTQDGEEAVVAMSTASDDDTRKWWPFDFRLIHRVSFGVALKLELTVTNTGANPFCFEEALHTYHRVGHIENVRITGLDGASYLDNTELNKEKTQQGDVVMTKPTDNAYLNAEHAIELVDGDLHRRVVVSKENSLTTVVWNPWREGARSLSDLGDDEWQEMACVEASNVLGFAVDLAPGHQHTMRANIAVKNL
jgi:glucose-6-phosphate 1-epimerase